MLLSFQLCLCMHCMFPHSLCIVTYDSVLMHFILICYTVVSNPLLFLLPCYFVTNKIYTPSNSTEFTSKMSSSSGKTELSSSSSSSSSSKLSDMQRQRRLQPFLRVTAIMALYLSASALKVASSTSLEYCLFRLVRTSWRSWLNCLKGKRAFSEARGFAAQGFSPWHPSPGAPRPRHPCPLRK